MMDKRALDAMRACNIETMHREQLISLSAVQLDCHASQAEKIRSFMEQIENPYCFLCGQTPVRVCFTDGGKSIHQAMERIFQRLRQV